MFTAEQLSPDNNLAATTFVDVLRARSALAPDKVVFTSLVEGETNLSYGELDQKARAIAFALKENGAGGQRVLLVYPFGLEYIAAFFGCLYAGAIAVPTHPLRTDQSLQRLNAIVADARPKLVLTTSHELEKVQCSVEGLRGLCSDRFNTEEADSWVPPEIDGETIAFLQYTSGSTATPRGVMVSHLNLLHNEEMITKTFRQDANSIVVSWLPPSHDMGLIGGILQPVYVGARCVLISPLLVLQNPLRWLQAISDFQATTSGGPNFAYDLCTQKISPEKCDRLDLSCWKVAFNGAEPVRSETLDRFARHFAPYGFRRESFFPCYGLAEATLMVAGAKVSELPALTKKGNEPDQMLVSCGNVQNGRNVVIVDPKTRVACGPAEIGEIWVSSPSVGKGYWNSPELTEQVFNARLLSGDKRSFLRTGDLGFVEAGELYVTGRNKDLIIIRGVNHYPHDIEATLQRCSATLRPNSAAAFSIDVHGEERLVVVQEVPRKLRSDLDSLIAEMRQAIGAHHEVSAYAVVLVKTGGVPRTSSGKIRRQDCKEAFLNHSLPVIASWQASSLRPVTVSDAVGSSILDWLTEIVAQKLQEPQEKINQNLPLTRFGLDSLTSLQIVHELQLRWGISIPAERLLQGLTISEIAELAARSPRKSQWPSQREDHPDTGSLSEGQKALWFIQHTRPDNFAYNVNVAVTIRGPLDSSALKNSFHALTARHAAFRTRFVDEAGQPRADVMDERSPSFHEEDVSAWSPAQMQAELEKAARRPFNLMADPLLRLSLYRRTDAEHILLFTVHHIVADFWSLAVLVEEFKTEYLASVEGRDSDRSLPACTYEDYVLWQRELLAGPEGESLWHYWKTQLSGTLPVLELPLDHPRPALQGYKGDSYEFAIDENLTSGLRAFSRSHDTTLFVTLLAVFQTLLHRYTNQDTILVGTPAAGRPLAEFGQVAGYFVNSIVLRSDFSDDPPFEEFLKRVFATTVEALAHQNFPFSSLVERLQPDRDASYPPLFQAMFVLQESQFGERDELAAFALGCSEARLHIGELELAPFPIKQGISQFDLTLTVAEHAGRLRASLQFNSALFEITSISRMAGHYQRLLREILVQPSIPVSQLRYLTKQERQQTLKGWNETQRDYGPWRPIHQMFEAQAKAQPEAVALVCGGVQMSYGELNRRANQLAHYLIGQGVGADVAVGVCMERSLELVVGLLGILKAGGAYVPLAPDYPAERRRLLVADLGLQVVLTQAQLVEQMAWDEGPQLVVLDETGGWDEEGTENPGVAVTEEQLAYIIYTSGSTGAPKGVMNRHSGISNRLQWMQETYELSGADVVLQKTPFSFDVSVWEFFWPLMYGARLVLARPGGHREAAYLVELIEGQGVTVVHFVPSMLREFLGAVEAGRCGSVRQVISSGEALTKEVEQECLGRLGAALDNLYGPTEAAVDVTRWRCERGGAEQVVPLGRPISNTELYVLDQWQQPVAVGVRGEIYIGGAGLARGYWQRAELTAERFVPHPYSARGGERLYRTGDEARYLEDGRLEYLGRRDQQVKVRGVRIELGEIEAVLESHARVRQAVVTVREESAGDQRLVGYVVGEGWDSEREVAAELRGYLQERLPEYMVPQRWVVLEQMPLTTSGKIDRKALPAPEKVSIQLEDRSAVPGSIEDSLRAVWSEVLGVKNIGVHDNFFQLGGHSLLITQVMSRVREVFGVEFPLQNFFESPTISSTAAMIQLELTAKESSEDIDEVLDMLEQMSETEVEEQLRHT